jgi:WD40 repeat protein
VRRELANIDIPEEHGARERAWAVVEPAFAERIPARRRLLRLRPAMALAAALAIAVAALSPPGEAVRRGIRDAIGVEHASPALFSLPSRGRLLIHAGQSEWVVQSDGSRRLLGRYREAHWSPLGRFVVAARKNELAALEPDGSVRWTIARPDVSSPRWTGTRTDTRIAYSDRSGIRVVAGDGRGDRLLSPEVGPLAWRPGTRFILSTLQGSELRLQDADTGRVVSRANAGGPAGVLSLSWSPDGRRALVVRSRELDLVDPERDLRRTLASRGGDVAAAAYSPDGLTLAVLHSRTLSLVAGHQSRGQALQLFAGAGPFASVTWSPDSRWLLVTWPAADQWVFVRADGKRIRAISNVSAQFHSPSFPRVDGWAP